MILKSDEIIILFVTVLILLEENDFRFHIVVKEWEMALSFCNELTDEYKKAKKFKKLATILVSAIQ